MGFSMRKCELQEHATHKEVSCEGMYIFSSDL